MHFSSTSLWVRQTPGSDSVVSRAAVSTVSSLGQARFRESRKWVSRPPTPAPRRRPTTARTSGNRFLGIFYEIIFFGS